MEILSLPENEPFINRGGVKTSKDAYLPCAIKRHVHATNIIAITAQIHSLNLRVLIFASHNHGNIVLF